MKWEEWAQFALLSSLLALMGLLSEVWYIKSDMSYGKFYSLSKYTKDVLEGLDGAAEISWFRSQDLPYYAPQSTYILDLLNEMQVCGGAKCIVRVYNAEEMEEAKLAALNLVPQNIEEKKTHAVAVKSIYSGIIVRLKGRTRGIAFVASASKLEYEILNLILQINRESANIEKRINLVFASNEEVPQYLAQWLSHAGFSTKELSLPLQNELDLSAPLFVVGSSKIDAGSATFIDVFLKKGGRAAFFVSGNIVDVAGGWQAKKKSGDFLIELLAEYGILIESDLVLDIANFPVKMLGADGEASKTINYPLWPCILYENLVLSSPIFSSITSFQTFWPSSIVLQREKNETLRPLATSTDKAIAIEKDYITDPFAQKELSSLFKREKNEKKVVMAMAQKPSKMIVASDENIVGRAIEYTNAQENMELALNIAFYLSENEEILHLRGKRHEARSFKFYEEEEFNAILLRARMVCFVAVPLFVLALYIFICKKNG